MSTTAAAKNSAARRVCGFLAMASMRSRRVFFPPDIAVEHESSARGEGLAVTSDKSVSP